MAKRTGTKTADIVINDPEGPGMIKSIQQLNQKNLEKYWDQIKAYQENSTAKKVVINLAITIDAGNGDTKIDAGIKASQCIKDKLTGTVTDPLQGTMTEIEAESENDKANKEEEEEPAGAPAP